MLLFFRATSLSSFQQILCCLYVFNFVLNTHQLKQSNIYYWVTKAHVIYIFTMWIWSGGSATNLAIISIFLISNFYAQNCFTCYILSPYPLMLCALCCCRNRFDMSLTVYLRSATQQHIRWGIIRNIKKINEKRLVQTMLMVYLR